MSYNLKSLKKIEGNKIVLDLEIANNYLKKSLNSAYKEISAKAKIPGFRKGKIPFNIIDINFGKDYVLNEAATIAISELYPRIIEESEIKPIDYPKIKINKVTESDPLDFEVTVEVEPEVAVPEYKGIKAAGISEEVTEEEVEKQVNSLKNNYATLENLEEDRAAEKGDFVVIDFEGKIDGQEFEGNSAQDYTLEIGSRTLFEEFENSLAGMKKGEHNEIKLTLPENIANKEIAGKEAVFSIDLKDIKKKTLPELDEVFIKNFGEFENTEAFMGYLREKLAEQKKKIRRDRIVTDIVNELVSKADFKVPEAMINNRVSHYMEDLENELKEHNISRDDYLRSFNLSEELFNENIRNSAEREVKEYLIFNALEKAESANIAPSEKQVEEESQKVLEGYKKEEEKNRVKEFLASPAGKKEFEKNLRRKNLIDLLVKNAKVVEEKDQGPEEGEGASKKLWTPGSETEEAETGDKKLWVPGSANINTKKENDENQL